MLKTSRKYSILILVLGLLFTFGLLLAACKTPAPATPTATSVDPNAVFTAAAQTAAAVMTQSSITSPGAIEPAPTSTIAPTNQPAFTGAPPSSATTPLAGATSANGTVEPAGQGDRAEFVSDVTVPDGTPFQPKETFVKTWRLKNSGSTTWTTAYSLVYVSGPSMEGPASVPLPNDVPPGQTVDITVNLVAPSAPGPYRSYWNLKTASGQIFGVGAAANEAIWVDIAVGGSGAANGTPAATSAAGTATTSASTDAVVTSASISVDNANISGPCSAGEPHTFRFSTQFTMSSPATVTYNLEAQTGFELTLPGPATANLGAGTHTVVYTLDFSTPVNGWARLHITAPNDVVSNQAAFSLTCQ